MADDKLMNITVGKELITPIVEAKISAAIIEHLADFPTVVNSIVTRTLMQRVEQDGKPTNSSYSGYPTYLDWVCNKLLVESVRKGIENAIASRQKEIEKEVEKQIIKNKSQLVQAFVLGMAETAKSGSYRLNVTVQKTVGED